MIQINVVTWYSECKINVINRTKKSLNRNIIWQKIDSKKDISGPKQNWKQRLQIKLQQIGTNVAVISIRNMMTIVYLSVEMRRKIK